jgi:hypothetical protein
MTETYIKLPNDSSNTGKLVRANERVVNGSAVEEHFMILQDYTNDNQASIDSTGHLSIVGSITSMPTIVIGSVTANVDSVYIQSGNQVEVYQSGLVQTYSSGISVILGSVQITNQFIVTGSESYIKNFGDLGSSVVVTNLYTGSNVYQGDRFGISGIVEVSNRVAGSIVDMPNITINNPSTIGSWTNINNGSSFILSSPGSIIITGSTYVTGSINISTTLLPISGNVLVSGNVNVTQTTNPWIVSGNVLVSGTVFSIPISGTSYSNVVSMPSIVGVSGTAFNNILGSVTITTMPTISTTFIGSLEVFSSTGSVNVYGSLSTSAGSESWIKGGSIQIYNPVGIGSMLLVSSAGSVGVYLLSGTQYTTPTSGTSWVNIASGTHYINAIQQSGTNYVNIVNSLGSIFIVPKSGTSYVNTTQTTSPWIIAGSVNIVNSSQEVGSPCFKQAGTNASGTYTQVWTIGGTGSRLEVHGWHISTNNPGIVTIVGSATTPILISNNFLNYASGALIEKTFSNPIVPQGANVHLGFQTTVAGSTCVTIYGREIK